MTHHPFYSFRWKHAIALFLLVLDRLRQKEILKPWDVFIEDNRGGKKLLKYRWFVPSFVDNAFNQPNWSFSFPFFATWCWLAGCWLVSLLLKKHFRESNQSLFSLGSRWMLSSDDSGKSHWREEFVSDVVFVNFFLFLSSAKLYFRKPQSSYKTSLLLIIKAWRNF